MKDIDEALTRLARAPLPVMFDKLEVRVLARIGASRGPRGALGIAAITVMALAIGVVGAGLPASPGAAAPLAPLGENSPYALSTLLAEAR